MPRKRSISSDTHMGRLMPHILCACALALCLTACDGDGAEPTSDADTVTDSAVLDAALPDADLTRCQAPEGVRPDPRSVTETVALINALPRPVTLVCFLEALARPIQLSATRGVASAQPADGARSPRFLLFYDPLYLTIAPAGRGQHLLEMGEMVNERHSLKAEVAFPVEAEVTPNQPFARIEFDETRTACSFCHHEERPATEAEGGLGYISNALAPDPRFDVPLEAVLDEVEACDPAAEPERCAMLQAVFGHGEVEPHVFDEAIPIIIEQ